MRPSIGMLTAAAVLLVGPAAMTAAQACGAHEAQAATTMQLAQANGPTAPGSPTYPRRQTESPPVNSGGGPGSSGGNGSGTGGTGSSGGTSGSGASGSGAGGSGGTGGGGAGGGGGGGGGSGR